MLQEAVVTVNNGFAISTETLAMGIAISTVDGPLPIGEIIFAGLILYDIYQYHEGNRRQIGLIVPNVIVPPTILNSDETTEKKPTPTKNPEDFTKLKGKQGYKNKETGEIYKKSHTSHGNKANVGEQWKIWPKGTKEKDMGSNSKSSGTRTTVDGEGNIIGN